MPSRNRRDRKRSKIAKNHQVSDQGKKARKAKFQEDQKVQFSAELMDHSSSWGWGNIDGHSLQDFFRKLFNFQGYTLQNLRGQGSHWVNIDSLSPNAQRRLREINQEDLEDLFSLRLAGKNRVWCIRDRNNLKLLWWDSRHEVCPSLKKHT